VGSSGELNSEIIGNWTELLPDEVQTTKYVGKRFEKEKKWKKIFLVQGSRN
jgi:hypothetical protein